MYKRNAQGWLKHADFIFLDVFALELAFLIAYLVRHGSANLPYSSAAYRTMTVMYFIVDVMVSAVFNTMHNVLKRGYYHELIQSLNQAVLVLVIIALYVFSVQSGGAYSRITIYLTALLHFILGYITRILWKKVVPKISRHWPKATMILVADEVQVPEILAKTNPMDDFTYKGIVLSNRDAEGEVIGDIPVVANLKNAADYICREWVDEVFVYPANLTDFEVHRSALYRNVEEFINDGYSVFLKKEYQPVDGFEGSDAEMKVSESTVAVLIEQCRQMAIPVHIRLPITGIGGKNFIEKLNGYNVLTTTSNYASPGQLAIKRVIDICGGLVGSLIALGVMAVVAPKIKKESPGPILFKQTRIGQNGKKFQIYKIRSMYMDAEERKKELLAQNRLADGMMFKLEFDPRVIGNQILPDGTQVPGIGQKIRDGSWDEWPQFFNVLLGHMSLVGTRPPTVDEWEKYKYHHRARLAIKPGITGMWQVSGRSQITDFEEVVRLDTEYINHWSVRMDVRILLKTVKAVVKREGAM